jgi:hypothetical protein
MGQGVSASGTEAHSNKKPWRLLVLGITSNPQAYTTEAGGTELRYSVYIVVGRRLRLFFHSHRL